jgi:ribosomal protein S11
MNILKNKRRILFFGKFGGVARIYIRRTHSNIFVTITDLKDRILKCVTSGSSGITGNKRIKRAPTALESIVRKCLPVFDRYRIQRVKIVLKTRISILYYTLLKELRFHGVSIFGVLVRRKIAFNGVRKRKLRRI